MGEDLEELSDKTSQEGGEKREIGGHNGGLRRVRA